MRRTTLAAAATMALLVGLFLAVPASAHHKPDHANGGAAAASDKDGDADSNPNTSFTEDNDSDGVANNISDAGDNAHPSGKDRSVEHGNSGNQGKSESTPDQDGRGPERDNGGTDKPNGPGGADIFDQDGNNGCGNDDDFDDDNEGNCGGNKDNKPPKDDDDQQPPKDDDDDDDEGDNDDDDEGDNDDDDEGDNDDDDEGDNDDDDEGDNDDDDEGDNDDNGSNSPPVSTGTTGGSSVVAPAIIPSLPSSPAAPADEVEDDVLGVVVTRGDAAGVQAAAVGGELAFTGGSFGGLMVLALMLLVAGAALGFAGRRMQDAREV